MVAGVRRPATRSTRRSHVCVFAGIELANALMPDFSGRDIIHLPLGRPINRRIYRGELASPRIERRLKEPSDQVMQRHATIINSVQQNLLPSD